MTLEVTAFFDETTCTISYVVADPDAGEAAIIDSVLDYDPKSGRTSTTSADKIIAAVRERNLDAKWTLDTHAHADHLTASFYLQEELGCRIGIGDKIPAVQETFKNIFNIGDEFATDGSQFDHLFADGERFNIGSIEGHVLQTPGHTPACCTYVIGDTAFVGDTIFMPDFGTARTDFPGGDARTLYKSIRKVLALPEDTRLFMCHDYGPNGRAYAWETTVGAERADNIHIREGVDETAFVAMRNERDATLDMPNLILPSVQVNIRAGRLPPPEDNGIAYLKIPLNAL